ncbi:MAG TPA: D-TA family PLP-dependent enzyme [Verrucomicrobiae bacterium]|nr:D-TA family PLP-dependent enzyme [Verrucomicrobiae bacterium]
MNSDKTEWFEVANVQEVPSPSLLLYPERIAENIRRMICMVGDAKRLRPHLKTHKLGEVLRMQSEQGITKFKCATIAEAEMAANAGAPDVLIAYPIVGPNVERFLALSKKFPATKFSCVADNAPAIGALSKAFCGGNGTIEVLLDIDCGQHRTGIAPGPKAEELYRLIAASPGLQPAGLHVYDGHIQEPDLEARRAQCDAAFAPVKKFQGRLADAGLQVPRVVAGGTPTFPLHARNGKFECSPGTTVLWDFSYSDKFKDLDFLHAAVVLARVISKPEGGRLCLDVGHKAIAAENPHPRIRFLNLPDAEAISHSEEHLVVKTPRAGEFAVGDCLYGLPRHVCPTVALYSEAVVVRNGRAEGNWRITARERRLTI